MIVNPSGSVVISAVTIVDENGDAASISGGTQYAEDAAHVSGHTGTVALAVRRDTAAVGSVTDGDYSTINVDASGQLWAHIGMISGVAPAFGSGAAGATVLRTLSATDDPVVTAITNGVATALPAVEAHIGEVGGRTITKSVTLSTDTSAYASGDLIADTQQIDAFFRKADGTGTIQSISIIDEDAQGVALYVIFMRTSTSLGSENSAPNISDANLTAGFLGMVPVTTADYVTLSGAKVATIRNIGLPVTAVSGTDDLYIAVLNSTGTPTFTAAGLEMVIGALLD
jgi:hypothetical protein